MSHTPETTEGHTPVDTHTHIHTRMHAHTHTHIHAHKVCQCKELLMFLVQLTHTMRVVIWLCSVLGVSINMI